MVLFGQTLHVHTIPMLILFHILCPNYMQECYCFCFSQHFNSTNRTEQSDRFYHIFVYVWRGTLGQMAFFFSDNLQKARLNYTWERMKISARWQPVI